MGVGQLSESDAVDALRLPFYSSSHPTGSHGWRNQFDLGNPEREQTGKPRCECSPLCSKIECLSLMSRWLCRKGMGEFDLATANRRLGFLSRPRFSPPSSLPINPNSHVMRIRDREL